MNLKKFALDIVKAAVIGFAVGAAIAFVAPTLGAIAGIDNLGMMAKPLFMGLFAGSWGAFGAAVGPVGNYLFGKVEKKVGADKETAGEKRPMVMAVTQPSREELQGIAKDAVRETGAREFLKQFAAAKDPAKRQRLKTSWEEKMAARKSQTDPSIIRH